MLSPLMLIQEHVKQCVKTIHSFFDRDIDIDVCDSLLIRIAGTGRFGDMIGQKIRHNKLSTIAMSEKRDVFVFFPTREEPCRSCEYRSYCGNYARMVIPIIDGRSVLGALSITAVNPEQGRTFLTHKDRFVPFMRSMADLILLKVRELEWEKRREHFLRMQASLVNAIRDGVMILDRNDNVVFINKRGEDILGVTIDNIRKLARDGRFSLVRVGGADGEEEYKLAVHRTKMRLVGQMYHIGDDDPENVQRVFLFADKRTLRENLVLPGSMVNCTFDDIIGESPAFREAVETCRKAAFHNTPVLLAGEIAIGKEVFARAMHNVGVFRNNRFVRVALAGDLQALLDHESMDRERMNSNDFRFKPEALDGNTVYIDEVGDFAMENQSAIHALVRDSRLLNTRVICSTSKNLEPFVESGEFHPELYYALEVSTITIPPVRARGNDIILLAEHYLDIANAQMSKNLSLSREVHALLLAYPWRGNVREIENTMAYLVENADVEDEEITPDRLPASLRRKFEDRRKREYNLEEAEKRLIVRALNDLSLSRASRADVAKALGISNATLFRKLKQYDIHRKVEFDWPKP